MGRHHLLSCCRSIAAAAAVVEIWMPAASQEADQKAVQKGPHPKQHCSLVLVAVSFSLGCRASFSLVLLWHYFRSPSLLLMLAAEPWRREEQS